MGDSSIADNRGGGGVAFLDTHSGIVDMLNVSFHSDALGTWFMWGGKVYRYHIGGDLHVMRKAG